MQVGAQEKGTEDGEPGQHSGRTIYTPRGRVLNYLLEVGYLLALLCFVLAPHRVVMVCVWVVVTYLTYDKNSLSPPYVSSSYSTGNPCLSRITQEGTC